MNCAGKSEEIEVATNSVPTVRLVSLSVRHYLVTVVLGLGSLSGYFSNSGYGNPWFDALEKPSFIPPGWVFGAAWTTLYTLMGISLALVIYAFSGIILTLARMASDNLARAGVAQQDEGAVRVDVGRG